MRCLNRNKKAFWVALYAGKEQIIDANGNMTGQYAIAYNKPKRFMANISAAKGETNIMQFGDNESYDRVIVMDNPNVAIDEAAVLWIDSTPKRARDGSLAKDDNGNIITPWDYVVRKVARSINSVSIAVSKVIVGG